MVKCPVCEVVELKPYAHKELFFNGRIVYACNACWLAAFNKTNLPRIMHQPRKRFMGGW